MTIIFTNADFWIESHIVSITLDDPAGQYLADLNLDKGGRCVGFSAGAISAVSDTNTQAVGQISMFILTPAPLSYFYGIAADSIRIRVVKAVSTSGAIAYDYMVIVYMRK